MKTNCYLHLYQYLKSRWSAKDGPSSSISPRQDLNSSKPREACSAADFRIHGRTLHYSFKIGDRKRTIRFYRQILGMKVLRHEEFTQSCEFQSNSPYDSRWSKTMVGYGAEDDYFAFELTYNYPVHNYLKGNEFISVTIRSREVIARAKTYNWPILDGFVLEAPGGYRFHILDEPQPTKEDPVVKITLACSDYKKSLHYWHGVLGLILFERDNKKKSVLVGFKSNEVRLEFQQIEQPVLFGEQSGRIYFSCPHYQQPEIAEKITNKGFKVVVPLVALETPGKATVRVIIFCDYDGHEVCFVEDLAFRQVSQYSPEDEENLDKYLAMENERDDIIGEPAKKAEDKQIEDSVKKAYFTPQKGDTRKTVSIALPISNIYVKDSEISTIQPDEEEKCQKIETRKMTVIVTTHNGKDRNVLKKLPRLKKTSIIKKQPQSQSTSPEQKSSVETQLGEEEELTSPISEMLPEYSEEGYTKNLSKTVVGTAKSHDTFKPKKSKHRPISSELDLASTSVSKMLKPQPRRSEEIEAAVQKVVSHKIEETINTTVTQNLEATVNKVVSEKISETVQKAVSEKIVETVAKAVAQIEESVKNAVSNTLPIIEEETVSGVCIEETFDRFSFPYTSGSFRDTPPEIVASSKRPNRASKLFSRRSKIISPLKES